MEKLIPTTPVRGLPTASFNVPENFTRRGTCAVQSPEFGHCACPYIANRSNIEADMKILVAAFTFSPFEVRRMVASANRFGGSAWLAMSKIVGKSHRPGIEAVQPDSLETCIFEHGIYGSRHFRGKFIRSSDLQADLCPGQCENFTSELVPGTTSLS